MKKHNLILRSFANAGGTVLYICAVALFFSNAEKIFGNEKSFLIPVFMLLLFVISASITGLLVLGKPIHLYLSGSKKEAVVLLIATLGWMVIFLIAVAAALVAL